MKKILAIVTFIYCIKANSQATNYLDPAQVYNKIMLEKGGDNSYDILGTYKVKGTPYLYGGKQTASLFSKNITLQDVLKVSYNTYKQNVELYVNTETRPEIKNYNEVDSFFINVKTQETKGLFKFYSTSLFETKEKAFLQQVYAGTKYSLYKRYKSELAYVSTNIVQSELREYDLIFDYFYVEANNKALKKIKLSANGVVKEFKKIVDVTPIVNEGSFLFNPEDVLIQVFEALNK